MSERVRRAMVVEEIKNCMGRLKYFGGGAFSPKISPPMISNPASVLLTLPYTSLH